VVRVTQSSGGYHIICLRPGNYICKLFNIVLILSYDLFNLYQKCINANIEWSNMVSSEKGNGFDQFCRMSFPSFFSRLSDRLCPSILMNGPTDFAQTHFFRFVMVEMTILGFDIWSFVFVYGYIDPKWGMFWFLSLMIMSFKTLLTGKSRQNLLIGWVFAFTFDTLECNKSRKTPGCH